MYAIRQNSEADHVLDFVENSVNSRHEVMSLRNLMGFVVTFQFERHQKVRQSGSTEHDLSLGDDLGLVEILLGKGVVRRDVWVNDVLGDQEGLVGPLDGVEVVGVLVRDLVLLLQGLSKSGEFIPFAVSEWKFGKAGEFVDHGVPDGVQVGGSLLCWKIHEVAAKISLHMLMVDFSGGVEWLVDVAQVVDEEPHSIGKTIVLGVIFVGVLHDHSILVSLLVPIVLVKPHFESTDDFGDVVGVPSKVVVFDFASLIEEWLINKMPWSLPVSTLRFYFISPGSTLDHGVLVLGGGPRWISDL